MKRYIKNKNFLPNNLNTRKEKIKYKKYFILGLIILNLFLFPINLESFYENNSIEESIPIYKEEDIVRYYEEIEGIIDILYNNFKEGTINNNKGQIITDNLEEIYKIDEQNKIKIRFIRKEENSDYILEVEL